MGKKKIRFSLMLKIMLFSLILVLVSSFVMEIFAYRTSKAAIKETMGTTALNIIDSVIDTIDITKYEDLLESGDMDDAYYTELREKLNEIKNETGLKYLYTMQRKDDGTYIYVVDGAEQDSEEASLFGDVETELSDAMRNCFDGEKGYELTLNKNWGGLASAFVPIRNEDGKVIGMLGADLEADQVFDQLKDLQNTMLITAVMIAALGIPVSILFAYVLVRSLKQLQAKMQLVKQGDLTVQINNNRNDEVGSVASAFQQMITNMADIIRTIRNNTIEIVQSVNHLNNSVNATNKATEEITNVVNEIADGASEQVGKVEEVSSSMELIFHRIEQITKVMEQINSDSTQSRTEVEQASMILKGSVNQISLVNDTVEDSARMMEVLQEKFQEIQKFSELVSSIADQTSLLSINASIEAASAGEHGRGFAIVADEIKKLAYQSDDASNQINQIIQMIQTEIKNSSTAIGNGVLQARDGLIAIQNIDKLLLSVTDANRNLDNQVKEAVVTIQELESNGQNVHQNTIRLAEISREFSSSTQQTAASTEEQFAIMEEIRQDLDRIKSMIENLEHTVNEFRIK